jgi:hypothetical protein
VQLLQWFPGEHQVRPADLGIHLTGVLAEQRCRLLACAVLDVDGAHRRGVECRQGTSGPDGTAYMVAAEPERRDGGGEIGHLGVLAQLFGPVLHGCQVTGRDIE